MGKTIQSLTAADLFCGAGGFTTGAVAAGVDVLLAVNHWRTAVFTHERNHPGTRHICARIDDIDPRHDKTLPEFDLLLASPECTHHSIARGGRPIDDQKRATPWHVCVWAEAKRPKWLLIENVREFRDWGPIDEKGRPVKTRKGETFRAWIKALEAIGYQVDHQVLNAADFGAPTRRHRLFILARRGSAKQDIPWPEATHAGRWRAAAEIIDWSRPCPSIFSRKRPLADNTLKRIEAGLRKFVEPFVVALRNNQDGLSLGEPLSTVCTSGAHHALCTPFLAKYNGHGSDHRCHSPSEPLRTLDTQNRFGVVTPYLVPHFGERDGQHPRSHSIDTPLPTVTGQGAGSVVLPFVAKYYGTGGCQAVSEPLDTVTAKDRFGLAMVSLLQTMRELSVVDIGLRMLGVDELAAAQGFPPGYYLHGTKAEQVRQVGNAVCPPVAEALCRTIAEAT